jgi:hypothetical protein
MPCSPGGCRPGPCWSCGNDASEDNSLGSCRTTTTTLPGRLSFQRCGPVALQFRAWATPAIRRVVAASRNFRVWMPASWRGVDQGWRALRMGQRISLTSLQSPALRSCTEGRTRWDLLVRASASSERAMKSSTTAHEGASEGFERLGGKLFRFVCSVSDVNPLARASCHSDAISYTHRTPVLVSST